MSSWDDLLPSKVSSLYSPLEPGRTRPTNVLSSQGKDYPPPYPPRPPCPISPKQRRFSVNFCVVLRYPDAISSIRDSERLKAIKAFFDIILADEPSL